jgi:hypothetical protein
VTVNNASRSQIIITVVVTNAYFPIDGVKTEYHQIFNFGLIDDKLHGFSFSEILTAPNYKIMY